MEPKKRKIILLVVGILLGVCVALGIGYAFFIAQVGNKVETNIDITSDELDRLTFTKGTDISLNANQFNFTEVGSNLTSSTTSSANLKANSTNKTVSSTYNAYFVIDSNSYIYTQNASTPEIILTITNPTGSAVTTIEGLTYVTSGGVSGFDITNKKGTYMVAGDYAISATDATSGTTQNWTATLTYINLSTDQTPNEGHSMSAKLILQKDKITFADKILANNGGATAISAKGTPSFSVVSTTNDGMYAAADDYGTSYYYRGAVNNNWVKFANMYWRIIRINGDNTVRMIYSGNTAPTSSTATVMTGTGTQIGTSAFNSTYNRAEYVGYMYTLGNQHGYGTSSTIKSTIDTWYTSNLASYASKIADSVYCNDRSKYSGTIAGSNFTGTGVGTTAAWFGGARRLINSSSWAPIGTGPTLKCPTQSDAFTVSDTTKGNAHLTNPVGLITADEVSMAGAIVCTGNSSYYLYTGQSYWTGSPYSYYCYGSSNACEFFVASSGGLSDNDVYGAFGVRPVVSLKSNIGITGSGTYNDPYLVN